MGEVVHVNFGPKTISGLEATITTLKSIIEQIQSLPKISRADSEVVQLCYLAELCEEYLGIYDTIEEDLIEVDNTH